LRQTLFQGGVVGVKTQTDNVHRLAHKGDRNFNAGQVMKADLASCRCGALLTANFVVVCQRPKRHALGLSAFGKGFRGEGAV